jgi:hypothetical protein
VLYFSPLPRFNFGVYADWNGARKPRLILHVNVSGNFEKNPAPDRIIKFFSIFASMIIANNIFFFSFFFFGSPEPV